MLPEQKNWVIITILYEDYPGKIKWIYCTDCKYYWRDISKRPKVGDRCPGCKEGIGQVECL